MPHSTSWRQTATYRCFHCLKQQATILNRGPRRRLWCGHCACLRPFYRVEGRLTACAWPPPAREGKA